MLLNFAFCARKRKSGGQTNMDVLLHQMAAHGYEGQPVLTDSSECTAFGVGGCKPVLSFHERRVDSIFSTCGCLLSGCVRQGLVLPKCFWPTVTMTPHSTPTWLIARCDAKRSMKNFPAQSGQITTWRWQNLCGWGGAKVRHPCLVQNSYWQRAGCPFRSCKPNPLIASCGICLKAMAGPMHLLGKKLAQKHVVPTMLPKMNLWLEAAPPRKTARLMLGCEALLYSRAFHRCYSWKSWKFSKLKQRPLAW